MSIIAFHSRDPLRRFGKRPTHSIRLWSIVSYLMFCWKDHSNFLIWRIGGTITPSRHSRFRTKMVLTDWFVKSERKRLVCLLGLHSWSSFSYTPKSAGIGQESNEMEWALITVYRSGRWVGHDPTRERQGVVAQTCSRQVHISTNAQRDMLCSFDWATSLLTTHHLSRSIDIK